MILNHRLIFFFPHFRIQLHHPSELPINKNCFSSAFFCRSHPPSLA